MGFGSKFLAAFIGLGGAIAFPYLIFMSQGFRTFYWDLVGQNIMYASIGAIATFSFIIALASFLWNKA
jgi:hypothetical protein